MKPDLARYNMTQNFHIYSCMLISDYVGAGCQFELDACQEGVCQNDAKCILTEHGGYECICEPGKLAPTFLLIPARDLHLFQYSFSLQIGFCWTRSIGCAPAFVSICLKGLKRGG